ncbi:MAG: allantoinase, partial [Clostridiales bacterium]
MSKLQLIIKNATYYSNDTFHKGNIMVNDGKIVGITDKACHHADCEKVIDAEGLCVLPGVVDSHVHFR